LNNLKKITIFTTITSNKSDRRASWLDDDFIADVLFIKPKHYDIACICSTDL